MRDLAMKDLQNETYLEVTLGKTTIQTLVNEDIVPKFENEYKRNFKYQDQKQTFRYRVRGLRHSATNPRLTDNEYRLS
jgi:hypothetical protein